MRNWGHVRGLGERHPEDQDELEGVVEGEPVDGVDGGLENAGQQLVLRFVDPMVWMPEGPTYVRKA